MHFRPPRLSSVPAKDHGWDRFETTLQHSRIKKDLSFVVWHKTTPSAEWSLDTDWYIIGMSHPEQLAENMPKFEAVRNSFSLGLQEVPSTAGV